MIIWGFWKIYLFIGLGEVLSVIFSFFTLIFIFYVLEEIAPSYCEFLFEGRVRHIEYVIEREKLEMIERQKELASFKEKHKR
jgi:hypothetical protein